jgi:hypothetical protein
LSSKKYLFINKTPQYIRHVKGGNKYNRQVTEKLGDILHNNNKATHTNRGSTKKN